MLLSSQAFGDLGTYTTHYSLYKPGHYDTTYELKFSSSMDNIDAALWYLRNNGDNLGNHIATTTLNMNGNSIVNAASGTFTSGITASSFTATGTGLMGAQLRFSDGNILISSASAAQLNGVYVSTNLYIVGIASASKYYGDGSNLTGIATSSNTVMAYNLTRTLGVSGATVEIGVFSITGGAHNLKISITVSESDTWSVAKQYILPMSYAVTDSYWRDAVPFSKSVTNTNNDFELEVNGSPSLVSLRLRRTGAAAVGGTAHITIEQTGATTDTFTPSSATGTSSTNALLSVTPLMQSNGKVYVYGDVYSTGSYHGDGSYLTGIIPVGGVSSSTVDNIPVGTFIQYGSTTAPASYLYCDGTHYSTTTYSVLFNVIGYNYGGMGSYFTCDFRGMFARGVDAGAVVDKDHRVIGSTQTDSIQGHDHFTGGVESTNISAGENTDLTYWSGTARQTNGITNSAYNLYGYVRVSSETRPVNIAVAVMVKYQIAQIAYISTTTIVSDNVFQGSNSFQAVNATTMTATKYYGDGSALTGLSISKSGLFYSTDTLPFSQLASSATLALSANVIPSSATGNYSLIASSANYAAMAGNVITGSTFTVLAFATGGDVFYASTTFEANMGMVYAIDQSTVNITGFNCYVVAESTVAGVSFNIAFSTSVGQTTTYSYLNSSAITVSTTSKYSGWVSPSDTVRSYVSNLPAWLSLHTTSIPGSGTLQSGYGCLMRFWRRIDQ